MRRAIGVRELLDGPLDADVLAGNLRDLRRANRLLGGTALSRRALVRILANARSPEHVSLLDIGTGGGDIPAALAGWLAQRGVALSTHGVDMRDEILAVARERLGDDVTPGRGERLPFESGRFDVAHLSLVVHHLEPGAVRQALAEAARVSRLGVIVNDLDRTWRSWLGAWLLSRTATRNRYTRHDAPLSVRRAYHVQEVADLAEAAGLSVVGRWWDPWRYRYSLALVPSRALRAQPAAEAVPAEGASDGRSLPANA
jgi:ubiquinone/menaquinone biosynthesis C-methylase UbiE